MQTSWSDLVVHHESLRTTFHFIDGEPRQVIHPPFPVEIQSISIADSHDVDGVFLSLLSSFELDSLPLFKIWHIHSPESEYLALDIHHIISDGISSAILLEELAASYKGVSLPEISLHYKDYAAWQAEGLRHAAMRSHEDFWLGFLSGELPVLSLPLDRPRPAVQRFE